MRNTIIFLLAILLGYPSTSVSQSLNFNFHKLTEEDGVPASGEYFFFRDSRDYVWIGSENGLLRFDGHNLFPYRYQHDRPGSLPDNRITSQCFEDEAGDLWFTTQTGLVVYHRDEEVFVVYTIPRHQEPYQAFYQDKDQRIWLRVGSQASGSLWFFDCKTKAFTQSSPLTGTTCQVVNDDNQQSAYIVQTELPKQPGLSIIHLTSGKQESVEFIKTSKGDTRNQSSPTMGLYVEDNNTLWAGIYNGLGKYQVGQGDNEGVAYLEKAVEDISDLSFVTEILSFQDSFFLVSSDNGLFLFDRTKESFSYQFQVDKNLPGSLPFNKISTLTEDHSSVYWLGSSQGEVAFASQGKYRFKGIPSTIGQSITTMKVGPANDIWISTLENFSYYVSRSSRKVTPLNDLSHLRYPGRKFSLPPIDEFLGNSLQSWWARVGNQFILWAEDKQQFTYRDGNVFGVPNSSEDAIGSILQKGDKTTLINHGRKIYQLKVNGTLLDTVPWHNLQHLRLDPIVFIGEDNRNRVYIGDQSGRLVIVSEQGNGVAVLADLPNLGTIHALQHDTAGNTLYLATSKGLAQLHPETFELTWFTEEDYLPQEAYYNAIPDEFGQLWLPGNNGLVRYHPETKAFHRFTTADGLLSNVFTRNASLRAPETGEIWLGGKNGVNVFHPKDITLSDFKPNISIAELLVNDTPFEPKQEENKGNLNEKESLTFNYQDNTLSFRFVALDYSDPEANEYYYQMEGYDDERVYAGTRNFVRYPNLPAGKYTFKVWATNSDKVLNEIPKALSLIIIPPIYQRWWFYLLCLIAVSAIMYAIFQYRLEQALKVERLRVKISSDLHDDVGGMLSGLAMQTELLELTASEDTKPKLARVAEMSRSAMSRMRDTVWAIDARKDTLADLIDRMREHAEETLPPRNIQYSISSSSLELKRSLATDVRQSLYLIYKEAITNVAKHSKGDTVNIDLSEQNGKLEMSIHDNGDVQQKAYKTTGAGQSNMRMRAASIGAELVVDTTQGFRIQLRYPS